MRIVALAAMTCVAGCTMLLGLDPIDDTDTDHDGRPDSIDNCPTVYNPDQSNSNSAEEPPDMQVGDACDPTCSQRSGMDSDGDGIDNACDGCDNRLPDNDGNGIPDACEGHAILPCAIGPLHDEDGDNVADGCDVCPARPDSSQDDTDQDGVGDACDSPAQSMGTSADVQLFDAFTVDNQLWYTFGAPLVVGNDVAVAKLAGTNTLRMLGVAQGRFVIQTRVQLAPDPMGQLQVDVFAADHQGVNPTLRIDCIVTEQGLLTAGTQRQSTSPPQQLPFPVTEPFYVILTRERDGTFSCGATASLLSTYTPVAGSVTSTAEMFPGLEGIGAGALTFFHYDVVSSSP
jgi:hypothetical protein